MTPEKSEPGKRLHLLVIEDSPRDAELIISELERGGYELKWRRIETEAELISALDAEAWEAIVSDYRLPHFDGLAALHALQAKKVDIPFIIVSGTIGEEIAVAAMKEGAHDYIMKDDMRRLVPAMDRELREAGVRQERRSLDEALKKASAQWRTTFDVMSQAICILDHDRLIIRANKAFHDLVNKPWNDIAGQHCYTLMHSSGAPPPDCPLTRAFVTRHHEEGEMLIGARWFNVAVDPIFDDAGEMTGAVHALMDITQRKRNEDALHESEHRYRELVQNANSAIIRWRNDGVILFFNEYAQKLFGYTDEEAVGQHVSLIVPEKESSGGDLRALVESIAAHPERYVTNINENVCRNGQRIWMAWTNKPILDDKGQVVEILAIGSDITSLRKIEDDLARSEQRYRILFESSRDSIVTLSPPDWPVKDANPAALNLFKVATTAEIEEVAFLKFFPERQPDGRRSDEKFTEMIDLALRKGSHYFEWTFRRIDGEAFIAAVLFSRVQIDGEVFLQASIRNITGQKRLEEQTLHSQRLESLGTLAGGIAHDLNNILVPLLLGPQELQKEPLTPSQREVVVMMESAAKRGVGIVKQVLTFARQIEGVKGPIQTKHVIREVQAMIQATFPRAIAITVDLPKELWTVDGDATHLQQVLMNLCVNARDAMSTGGGLTIRAKNQEVDEAFSLEAGLPGPGTYVVWTVTDTGEGIPAEILPKIFDPFFTTKKPGKGTGLGLSTLHGIVKNHGGIVRVQSTLGQGSVFEVFLPASKSESFEATAQLVEKLPQGKGECILVVDDEADIREISRTILEKNGYKVVLASDGVAAITVFTEKRQEIKGVILDMLMPVMDGAVALKIIRRITPQIPILAVSGMTEEMPVREDENTIILSKPFGKPELLIALHTLLGRTDKGTGS